MGATTRRDFIARGSALGAGLTLLGPDALARRAPLARAGAFPQGVAAGEPGQRSATLWTRVDGHEGAVRLRLEVARDPGFRRVVHESSVPAAPLRDFTAHRLVTGLEPGETYWYRFATRTSDSPVGRFRTRRPPDSREPVRIAIFSCQGWQPGYYNAHAGMAGEDLDLAVCLGDYIYEKTDDTGPRTDPTGKDGDGFAQTLDEYRAKWRLYRSDPDIQSMHAAHGFSMIWDNHELADDSPGHLDGAELRVPLAERVRHGKIAFFENVPMRRFRRDRFRIHRRLVLGRHAELMLLDESTFADYERHSQFLGREQMGWLKHSLERSRASWKLIGSQKMMMALDVPRGMPLNPGQWDGFPEEREELMRHVLDRRIRGVSVLSGDIHTFFAGVVTTTGRDDGEAAATEFVGGALTSEPGPEMFFGDAGAEPTGPVFEQAPLENPHIKWNNHRRNGYAVIEARDEALRVDFRAVRSKLVRPSPTYTLARFRVPVDEPRVEVLSG